MFSRIFHAIFKDMIKENNEILERRKNIVDDRKRKEEEARARYLALAYPLPKFEPFKDFEWSYGSSSTNLSQTYCQNGWEQFY